MYVSLLLILGAVCCAHIWLRLRWRRARLLLAHLPTYPELPFIGNFHWFFGSGSDILRKLDGASKISEQKNLPFVVWVGPFLTILFSDGDEVKEVTNKFVEKPYYYNFTRIWLGDGILTAPGSLWKRNIKPLAGAFNSAVVEGYQTVFNAHAHALVSKLKGEVGRGPFDVLNKYLAYTTLEAICQTALGVPSISEKIVSTAYYNAFNRAVHLLMKRGFNLLMHFETVYRLTPSYRELVDCVSVLHNVSDIIINKRIAEWEEKKRKREVEKTYEPNGTKFKSFLDILLELEGSSKLTPLQIKNEVDTIILGGQETNASTLMFILIVIGWKTDIQDKMYAEIKQIFGDSKRPVEKDDLSQMVYCEAVIYETLRLYPPAPVIMRWADKELKLKSCTIPKGTGCGINVWGAGRSQRAWGADAEEFSPERWLRADSPCPASSFLAFSYGRRACIGKKYGIAILKTMLAYCLRELKFQSDGENLVLAIDLILRPVTGHHISVDLR